MPSPRAAAGRMRQQRRACRRLGLTATLVREDGRVTLTDAERMSYATAEAEERYRTSWTPTTSSARNSRPSTELGRAER